MLKIKDDVDLKELEKFELEFNNGYNEYRLFEKEQIFVDCETREIGLSDESCYNMVTDKPLNILFDLIQAGLVEKVEE